MKTFADDKSIVANLMAFVFERMENSVYSFLTMFTKALCFRVVKMQNCMVKSYCISPNKGALPNSSSPSRKILEL